MKIIEKYTIPEADLTSNVSNAYSDWSSSTTYSTDDVVVHNKKVWKALSSSTDSEPANDNTNWEFISYSNVWRFSDEIVGTFTTNSDSIEMSIDNPATLCNGIAFLNVSANSITVIVTDTTDGEVYNHTEELTVSEDILSWYDYFFEPFSRRTDVVFSDLPAYFGSGVTIDISIDYPGDNASVGELVLGNLTKIGETIYPLTTRIIDYSRKVTDANGNFIIEEKPFKKMADFAVAVEAEKMNSVQNFLASIRTTPTVFVGDVDFRNSIIYGYYKDFSIVFDTPPLATCNLSVEGLI